MSRVVSHVVFGLSPTMAFHASSGSYEITFSGWYPSGQGPHRRPVMLTNSANEKRNGCPPNTVHSSYCRLVINCRLSREWISLPEYGHLPLGNWKRRPNTKSSSLWKTGVPFKVSWRKVSVDVSPYILSLPVGNLSVANNLRGSCLSTSSG